MSPREGQEETKAELRRKWRRGGQMTPDDINTQDLKARQTFHLQTVANVELMLFECDD